jgi:glucose/arabinose dehydrogenase
MRTYGRITTIALALLTLAGTARAGAPNSGVDDTLVVGGLSTPTAIAFLPDGRPLVAQKSGALRLVESGVATTLVTIPVCSGSEMGLLGIAIDPAFASNGFIYLYRTNPVNGCGSSTGRFNEVVRVTMVSDAIDIGSLVTLLSGIRTDNGNHDGGVLRIGPDEKLYVGVGDTGLGDNVGSPGTATNPYAQDQNALEGKILRLNLDGTIPGDNPFVGQVGKRAEIFAYGFRNPFRMGFDPLSGSLWVGDVGDLTVEEIDIVTAGGNYSWPYCEATLPSGCAQAGDVAPIVTYPHSGPSSLGTSITGGAFAGASFGGLENDYFFGDYIGNAIYHLEPNGSRTGVTGGATTFVSLAGGPVDIVFGPDGALYYVAIFSGQVRRVAPLAPPSDVDAYLCTKAALARGQAPLPQGTTTSLSDDLVPGPLTYDVRKAASFCTPVSVNGSTIVEAGAHQEGFSVKRVKGSPKFAKSLVSTGDQFGARNLFLTQETSLLVPSSAVLGNTGAPPYARTAVDHYKCYRANLAKGSPKFVAPSSPTVSDGLIYALGQSLVLKKPTRYCEPVAADGSTINVPATKLVCYGAKLPAGTKYAKSEVSTSNPDFGDDVLLTTAVSELCVPASVDP